MADSFKTAAAADARMDGMTSPDVDIAAAGQFLAGSGRVLDQRRFERLFTGGRAEYVRDAVAAYRNPDGGFGHALEPDGRCPGSQPLAVEFALETLDEADARDDGLVGGASLITTGLLAGTLHGRGVRHPWLDRATELMWDRIGELDTGSPYDLRAVAHFLDNVPDRAGAATMIDQIAPLITSPDVVTLDPAAPGEIHTPLDFAPRPGSLARSWLAARSGSPARCRRTRRGIRWLSRPARPSRSAG